MTSTAVAGQDAFVALLEAAFPESVTHVAFAGTGKLPKTTELVWVLPVRSYRKEPGEQFEIESYDLAVRFEVFRSGETSGGDADARRWEMIDTAEDALRRKDFHGFRTKGGEVSVEESSLDLYDKGWIAVSEVTFGTETWLPLL